ncbi:hypothetical protein U1Q18_029333, partial [Sarracenia purpurea var. burkii]
SAVLVGVLEGDLMAASVVVAMVRDGKSVGVVVHQSVGGRHQVRRSERDGAMDGGMPPIIEFLGDQ